MARIEKLAHWRIDLSSLTFPTRASESCGGHAAVSEAWMKIGDMDMRKMEKRALGKNLNRQATERFLENRERVKAQKFMVSNPPLLSSTHVIEVQSHRT